MSNPTIANVLIVNWVFISVIVAGQGNVPLRSCYVNTIDTHLWRNCKISLYGSNGRATCDCVGCRDHRTIITCNDRGEWNLAELEDTTKSCSMCQNDVTCAYNGKCNQTSHNRRCYCNRNCQEIISACNNFGEWEHAVHLCFETSGTMTIGSDWKSVNWRSTSKGLELLCTNDYTTVNRGSAMCSDGKLSNVIPPTCTKPPCEGLPNNVNCSETSFGYFNVTRHCTCSHNTTINTTLRCSGGKWNLETQCPDMMVFDQTQSSWTTPVAATIAISLILFVTVLVIFVCKRKKKYEENSIQVIFHPNSEEIEVENELYYPAEGIAGVRESILQGYSTIDEMKQFVKSAAVSTSETENGDTLYTLPPK